MLNFVYETPTKVYFGKGEEQKVGKIVAEYAPQKVLLHYGGQSAKKSGLLDRVRRRWKPSTSNMSSWAAWWRILS